jgi:hypothetical protein
MKCSRVAELIPDCLTGTADASARAEMWEHISGCALCRRELESLEGLWRKLGALPDEEPGPGVRARFYTMLQGYREGLGPGGATAGPRRRLPWLGFTEGWSPAMLALQAAAALLFLVAGAGAGHLMTRGGRGEVELSSMRDEVQHLRQLVALSLLEQQSASERLRGVTFSRRLPANDPAITSALVRTLNDDPNTNVRLAAVDALSRFSAESNVRRELIDALERQSSPLVQIALIDLMVEIEERRSAEALRRLSGSGDVNPAVRQRAEWGLRKLS